MKRPGYFDGYSMQPQAWSRSRPRNFSGFGQQAGSVPPPSNAVKLDLTKNAVAMVEISKVEPKGFVPGALYGGLPNLLNGVLKPLMAQMLLYQGWPAESWCLNCYESSQIIKSNLSQAMLNCETRLGQRDPAGVIGGPMQTVSVASETIQALPAAVVEQAKENVAVASAIVEKAVEVAKEAATGVSEAEREEARLQEEQRLADEAAKQAQEAQDEAAKQAALAKKAELDAQLAAAKRKTEEAKVRDAEEQKKLKALGVDLAAYERKRKIKLALIISGLLAVGGGVAFYIYH